MGGGQSENDVTETDQDIDETQDETDASDLDDSQAKEDEIAPIKELKEGLMLLAAADPTNIYVADATNNPVPGSAPGDDTNGNGSFATPYATIAKAVSEILNSTPSTINILTDLTMDGTNQPLVTIGSSRRITIRTAPETGGRVTITRGCWGTLFNFGSSSTATISNIILDGNKGSFNDTTNTDNSLIEVRGGILILNNGATLRNNSAYYGAVAGYGNYAAPITLNGNSEIVNNIGQSVGGIYMDNGTLTMNEESSISNNIAAYAGGVYAPNNDVGVTLNGSSHISGNTGTNGIGGISFNQGIIILSGSSYISENIGDGISANINMPDYDAVQLYGNSSVWGNTGTGIVSAYFTANVVLNDNSSVHDNGNSGIRGNARVTLNDESSVTGNTTSGYGGGIYNINNFGGVTLNDKSSVTNNTAVGGGGIYASGYGRSLVLNDESYVTGNTTSDNGGGIYSYSSNTTIILNDKSSVANNTGGSGGGIYVQRNLNGSNRSAVTLNNESLVTGNAASSGNGGGIYVEAATTVTLNNVSSVIDNEASGNGGGIYSNSEGATTGADQDSRIILNGTSSVAENTASNGGGIYTEYTSNTTLNDESSVIGNIASVDGGGIYKTGTNGITLNGESSVEGNSTTTGSGGGISILSGSITLSGSSSVSGNTAAATGGGINALSTAAVALTGESSVSGNTASTGGGGIYKTGTGTNGVTLSGESSVSGNTTTAGNGGGINITSAINLTLSATSSVVGNKATAGNGGGVSVDYPARLIIPAGSNITFTGNSASRLFMPGVTISSGISAGTVASISPDPSLIAAPSYTGNLTSSPADYIYTVFNNYDINYMTGNLYRTLIFDTNGGVFRDGTNQATVKFWLSTTTSTVTLSNYAPLPNPTRRGYLFNGGYATSSAGPNVAVNITMGSSVTSATVYAMWTEFSDYKVYYDTQGGTPATIPYIRYLDFEDSGLIPSVTVTRANREFGGWFTEPYGGGIKAENNTPYSDLVEDSNVESVTLYAKWNAAANNYYVADDTETNPVPGSTEGSDTTGNGTFERPYATIQHVVDLIPVNTPSIIHIITDLKMDGTSHQPLVTIPENKDITVRTAQETIAYNEDEGASEKRVTILRGVLGYLFNLPSTSANSNLTVADIIVDGNMGNFADTNAGGNSLIYARSLTSTVTLSGGATIQKNRADVGPLHSYGTVYLDGNSEIINNIATNGGGIYMSRGTAIMNGTSSIRGNTGSDSGGGVYVSSYASITLNASSHITGNTSNCAAIMGNGGRITLNDSSYVSENNCEGAYLVWCYDNVITLNANSSISNNMREGININSASKGELNGNSSVKNNKGGGINAGVGNDGCYLTLNGSSSVTGNTYSGNGGGIRGSATVILNDSSSVTGNTATGNGGGIYGNPVTLNGSSSVTGNTAGGNGGGYFASNSATITLNGTSFVTGNTAGGDGGGIYIGSNYRANLIIPAGSNVTFEGNSASMLYRPAHAITSGIAAGTVKYISPTGWISNKGYAGDFTYTANVDPNHADYVNTVFNNYDIYYAQDYTARKLIYNANGGAYNDSATSKTIDFWKTYNITEVTYADVVEYAPNPLPTRAIYTFSGWGSGSAATTNLLYVNVVAGIPTEVFARWAQFTDYYVADSANNPVPGSALGNNITGDGTFEHPFATIQYVVNLIPDNTPITIHIVTDLKMGVSNPSQPLVTILQANKDITIRTAQQTIDYNEAQNASENRVTLLRGAVGSLFYVGEDAANTALNIADIIIDGNETGFSDSNGALIHVEFSWDDRSITLSGAATLRNNSSYYSAIYIGGGADLTMNDASSITDNTSLSSGGGISADLITCNITLNGSSSITGNKASDDGGGIYINVGSVTLNDNSSISGNEASGSGGGIYAEEVDITLGGESSIIGNEALDNGFGGGGIYVGAGSSVTLNGTDILITGNEAPNGFGGGIYAMPNQVIIPAGSQVTFANNLASKLYMPVGHLTSGIDANATIVSITPDPNLITSTLGYTGILSSSASDYRYTLFNDYDIYYVLDNLYRKLIFNPNGGLFAGSSDEEIEVGIWKLITDNTLVTLADYKPTPNPTRTDYSFLGYGSAANAASPVDSIFMGVDTSARVWAVWGAHTTLTVSNIVTPLGDADTNLDFTYVITFKQSDNSALTGSLPCSGGIIEDSGATAPDITGLTLNSAGVGSFTLNHGQKIIIENVPVNAKITIIQAGELMYTTSYSDPAATGTVPTLLIGTLGGSLTLSERIMSATRVIDFTNTKSVIVPSGLDTGNTGNILLTVGIIVFLMVVTYCIGRGITRRRKSAEL